MKSIQGLLRLIVGGGIIIGMIAGGIAFLQPGFFNFSSPVQWTIAILVLLSIFLLGIFAVGGLLAWIIKGFEPKQNGESFKGTVKARSRKK